MVDPTFVTVNLTRAELEMLQDALWHWTSSPSGPTNRRAEEANTFRRRLLRLELDAAGWGPGQDALDALLPEST